MDEQNSMEMQNVDLTAEQMGNLSPEGNTNPAGNTIPSENVNPTGNADLASNAKPTGSINPSGNASAAGNVNPTGNADLASNAKPTGSINPSGNASAAGNMNPAGNVNLAPDGSPTGNINPSGNASAAGNTSLPGNVNATQNRNPAQNIYYTQNPYQQPLYPYQQYGTGTPVVYGTVQRGETEEQKKKRAEYFGKMLLPTLIYGVLYTFFLYDNFSGITLPLFALATVYYCFYGLKVMEVNWKNSSWFYCGAIVLLGLSSALTANRVIHFFNVVGIILLLVCMLLHNYYDDRKWTFGKYTGSFFLAIFGAIGCIADPFMDASCYQKEHRKEGGSKMMYVLLGIVIAIPLLVIIVMLLYYADAVFAQFIRDIKLNLNIPTLFGILVMFLFAIASAYCGLRFLGKKEIREECKSYRNFEPVVAITGLTLISVVYLFFSIIQILYLFWGKMELPEGYTYAAYAREGFFQLLFVCIINVVMVLVVLGIFQKSIVIDVLLTMISGCTYIMLASSAFRMCLYIQAYHLSFLRIMVFWGLGLIALLLAGILIQIYREEFHLFQYGLVVVCVCYLVLGFARPDYWIAKYNLEHIESQSEKNMDYNYISRLSADAAPVIAGYQGSWVDRYVSRLMQMEERSLRQYNFSEAKARKLFAEDIEKKESSFCIIISPIDGETKLVDACLKYELPDGTEKTLELEQAEDSQTFFCTIWKEDLPEGEIPEFIAVTCEFYNESGEACKTGQSNLHPSYGKTYEMALSRSSYNDYEDTEKTYYYFYQKTAY